jgi:hypothetical protein
MQQMAAQPSAPIDNETQASLYLSQAFAMRHKRCSTIFVF